MCIFLLAPRMFSPRSLHGPSPGNPSVESNEYVVGNDVASVSIKIMKALTSFKNVQPQAENEIPRIERSLSGIEVLRAGGAS